MNLFSLHVVGKVNKKTIIFSNIEIWKCEFYCFKYLMNINNVDVDKITISNKVSFGELGFKYFIGYKDDKKVIYNGHVKSLDKTNCMFLFQ